MKNRHRNILYGSCAVVAAALILTQVYLHATHPKPFQVLEQAIQKQESLPRYVEVGYSPLGRCPVVDAALQSPFSFPRYGEAVSNELRRQAATQSLYEILTTVETASGIQSRKIEENFSVKSAPSSFIRTFGEEMGRLIYGYWRAFLQIEGEVEAILQVLSEDEKRFILQHYEAFFFGEKPVPDEYDFFTTASAMPLKFFELASRIDLVALLDAARKMSLIVDSMRLNREKFLRLQLTKNFSWNEAGKTLFITSDNHATFVESADFFIDIGGSNTFLNNAGGTEGKRCAALHIDFRGNNLYIGDSFVQGSGFLGVGMLASFGGNNFYKAKSYAQGTGFFGVGLLMNQEGKNRFEIDFMGQSAALFGSSLLWNRKGENQYKAFSGMAQAASSTLGIAFLLDEGGNDTYECGEPGKGGEKRGGIGQGGSTGVRNNPWQCRPSLYGGLSFLYNTGGKNSFMTPWIGQGSAYFLGAGVLVVDGSENRFKADFDAQGQGLHLSAGLLLKKGSRDWLQGGWGSIGVAADRSIGMLVSLGGENHYEGTDQSVATARKGSTLGLLIDTGGDNTYLFKNTSNTNIQWPSAPNEWPGALFMDLGEKSEYPKHVDSMRRGMNRTWGVKPHSIGLQAEADFEILEELPAMANFVSGVAYRPLKRAATQEELNALIDAIPKSDYATRRQIYESIDLIRFMEPNRAVDVSRLLARPGEASEDQLNYAVQWGVFTKNSTGLEVLSQAIRQGVIPSAYARKMAILFIGKLGTHKDDAALLYAMQSDPAAENRATAAYALACRADANVLKYLVGKSEIERYMIAKGLMGNTLPGVLLLVTPLLKDPSFYVRRAAALTAISLRDKTAIPVLLETLQYDTLDTEENYGDNIYASLAQYVGVDFGVNKAAWLAWWEQNHTTFQFPNKTK